MWWTSGRSWPAIAQQLKHPQEQPRMGQTDKRTKKSEWKREIQPFNTQYIPVYVVCLTRGSRKVLGVGVRTRFVQATLHWKDRKRPPVRHSRKRAHHGKHARTDTHVTRDKPSRVLRVGARTRSSATKNTWTSKRASTIRRERDGRMQTQNWKMQKVRLPSMRRDELCATAGCELNRNWLVAAAAVGLVGRSVGVCVCVR